MIRAGFLEFSFSLGTWSRSEWKASRKWSLLFRSLSLCSRLRSGYIDLPGPFFGDMGEDGSEIVLLLREGDGDNIVDGELETFFLLLEDAEEMVEEEDVEEEANES